VGSLTLLALFTSGDSYGVLSELVNNLLTFVMLLFVNDASGDTEL